MTYTRGVTGAVKRQMGRIWHWVKKRPRRLYLYYRLYKLRWKKLDRKYGWKWRAANLFAAVLVLTGILIPIAQQLWQSDRYTLSAEASQLVGETDPSLTEQLSYDAQNKQYVFNKAEIGTGNAAGVPAEVQKASVGATDKSNAKSYALQVPEDFSKGVTYYDTNSQLSFSLVPQFKSLSGKTTQGHIVFPLHDDSQAVYTLKNNGLKEDIVVPEVTQSSYRFDYTFNLPKTMEVRSLPDHSGGIGIYSADPALFSNISYGSDKDRTAVEKARQTADKTYLVFGLPAPVTKDSTGKEVGSTRFELNGSTLSVVAERLGDIRGPIAIDPSVVVTSTSDFQTGGNNEGMIDFGTSGQITRGGLTGGTVGTWATTGNSYNSSCGGVASTAYNGYLYTTGCSSGSTVAGSYAINTDGTLGNFNGTASMGTGRGYHRLEAYNGYLYAIGGSNGSAYLNTVEYAPIASNGTIGTWQAATSFTTIRAGHASAVYNGYLYIMGGSDGSTVKNDVQYAPIKADGSLGSWTGTTSFTTARANLGGFAYNGYLYIMGGWNEAGTYYSDTQYAKLNNNGTVGTWATTTSFTTGRVAPEVTVYNGYAYVMGGTANVTSALTDTQYAQINANGTLGSWRTSSTLNTGVWAAGTVAYNGYLYIVAGRSSSGTEIAATQYAAIDRAGRPVAFGTLANSFTTARALSCAVAYNGYLYNIGGSTSDASGNNVTTVQYTTLNSSTGNNGSWSSTTALPTARGSAGCVAYNGYLYVVGGSTGTGGTGTSSNAVLYTAINSNGTLGASWTTSGNSVFNLVPGKPGVFVYSNSNGTYMYVVGGRCVGSVDSSCTTVGYATVNTSTGALGTWDTVTNGMSQQWAYRGYAMIGKYLYAFGGYKTSPSTTATTDVEYTSINSDGSLATWQSTTSLNTAVGYTNGTTVNGCIYAVGGENNGGTSLNNVQYACPAANGTISAWYNAPNLSVATTDMGVTSYNGYIYGVGGYTTSVQTTTQYAYVNNGGSGSNSSWTNASNGLASGVVQAGSTNYNGYLYAAGGSDGSLKNTVQYGQMGANGDLGAFTTDGHAFTTARLENGAVAYNGYLYVLGGYNAGPTTWYGDVQYAPIGSSGGLGGNFASTTNFATGTGSDTGRSGICTVAYNGYIYALGGWDGTVDHNDVRYAAINSNGSLGSWADSGHNFTNVRSDGGCFVANGYLYILGGNGASNYNDVQSAQINSNGTLGAWNYTTSFPIPRQTFVTGVSNGFAYIMGGCLATSSCNTGSNDLGDTLYAPIYANGTLGAWQQSTTNFTNTYKISNGVGAIYNGYLYAGGGWGSFSGTSMYYAPLNTISRTARYSKLVDLGVPTNISSITYNGALPTSSATPGVVPISFRAAGSDGIFGSLTASSAITPGATSCLATSQNYKRYLLVTITLDGSGGQAILPDNASTYSNVTDFTVNYTPVHPPPNIRLRHGQTLQQGSLSPLDTCTP